jgi:rhamnulokinase
LPDASAYAAIDFGASSGRVLSGRLDGGRLELEEIRRFPNRPVRWPDGLHWDIAHLYSEALGALLEAGPLRGIGIDTWGVDYGLLDARGALLGLPFHYRDARTEGRVQEAFGRVAAEELYASTGIQTLPINTIFQLLAEPSFDRAERLALIGDLLAFWLTGELANERTAASTTGLLDASSGEWATGIIERLGLPARIFGELVDPGTALGPARRELDLGPVTVFAVGAHDTASAFVAAPLRDEHSAILSCGTWSLLGLELSAPVLSETARTQNLTNERGVGGTTRLLKNVMGLWLEQECAREWGADHAELFTAAAQAPADVPLFDPDDEAFLAPGDMPARIAAACEALGQTAPRDRGATIRSILVSLACKYRLVLEHLQVATGRDITCLNVIGGGVQIELLCQLTADITRRQVLAGPVEATAVGNVLVQALGAGELGSLAEVREVARAFAAPRSYEPSGDDAAYHRFLSLTGLSEPAHA